MSVCVTVLVLLHYDYNTIRNGPSIRANHYNYNAGGEKGITHDHPVKSAHGITSSMKSYNAPVVFPTAIFSTTKKL